MSPDNNDKIYATNNLDKAKKKPFKNSFKVIT